MTTERYILEDARQWLVVRKRKHIEDYETTYHHLHDELTDSLARLRQEHPESEK